MKTKAEESTEICLTDACKRHNITLASVVILMIKVPFQGKFIECQNAEEAKNVIKTIMAEEERLATERRKQERMAITRSTSPTTVTKSAWSKDSFWKFIESLKWPQQKVLRHLVRHKKATDQEVRKLLEVEGNQALAGVLSGISKQAANQGISARAVYSVEDERVGGQLRKTYVISQDFLYVAREMNWPGD